MVTREPSKKEDKPEQDIVADALRRYAPNSRLQRKLNQLISAVQDDTEYEFETSEEATIRIRWEK